MSKPVLPRWWMAIAILLICASRCLGVSGGGYGRDPILKTEDDPLDSWTFVLSCTFFFALGMGLLVWVMRRWGNLENAGDHSMEMRDIRSLRADSPALTPQP